MQNFTLETEKMEKTLKKVEVYNVQEISKTIGISTRKVRDMVQRGYLHPVTPYIPGNKILVAKSEIIRVFKI